MRHARRGKAEARKQAGRISDSCGRSAGDRFGFAGSKTHPSGDLFARVIQHAVAVEIDPGVQIARAARCHVNAIFESGLNRRLEDHAVFIVAVAVIAARNRCVQSGGRARLPIGFSIHARA